MTQQIPWVAVLLFILLVALGFLCLMVGRKKERTALKATGWALMAVYGFGTIVGVLSHFFPILQ